MYKLILAASAAAMAISMPALAKPGKSGGHGGTKAHASAKAASAKTKVTGNGRARTDSQANVRARTRTGSSIDRSLDTNRNGIADYRERRLADANANGIPDFRERRMVDINRNGVADYRERLIDRNRDGVDDRAQNRYGGQACPPGLAKKTPACVPPGQVGKTFLEGSRLPVQYGYLPVPSQYLTHQSYLDAVNRYDPDDYRYYYADEAVDRIYVVDPKTRLIRDVIDLAL